MGNFLVNADAGVAGKIVGGFRCRHSPMLFQKRSADFIQFPGRHSGTRMILHFIDRHGNDSADFLQAVNIVL
ncbi:hypothetical protein D3C75_1142870 [compost metagenome]